MPTNRQFHGQGPITIFARFQFLNEDPSINWEKQRTFAKPVFVFSRGTLEKPIPNTIAEQLAKGGIDYDLFAAAERWQKFNQKQRRVREQFDPFFDYRADPDYRL